MLGPEHITKAMGELQGQTTSNPNTIAQWAAVEALNGPQESVAAMNEQFERRRDFVVERLRAIPDLTCSAPGGAFYAFPAASAYYGRTLRGQTIEGSVSSG